MTANQSPDAQALVRAPEAATLLAEIRAIVQDQSQPLGNRLQMIDARVANFMDAKPTWHCTMCGWNGTERSNIEDCPKCRWDALVPAPHATAPAGAALPEWASCTSRGPWVRNSLKEIAAEMRASEQHCRKSYTKDFMGLPTKYLADTYAEAAAVFERRLTELSAPPLAAQGDKQ